MDYYDRCGASNERFSEYFSWMYKRGVYCAHTYQFLLDDLVLCVQVDYPATFAIYLRFGYLVVVDVL